MKRTIITVLIAVTLAAVAWLWFSQRDNGDDISVSDTTAIEVQQMVRLCSMEIYEEMPVSDSIDTRHLFARQLQQGSVSFDVENLDITSRGDTLVVVLPKETVELRESTRPGSWKVIDRWNTRTFGSAAITNAEENAMKARARDKAIRRLYDNGTIARARSEAATSLQSMLSRLLHRPVEVVDTLKPNR